VPLTAKKETPRTPLSPKQATGTPMTDNTELHRLMRLRRLGTQIAASLPSDLDREQASLPGARVHTRVARTAERPHTFRKAA
jgi:hypothetical protein